MKFDQELNVTGLVCPVPALKTKKQLMMIFSTMMSSGTSILKQ